MEFYINITNGKLNGGSESDNSRFWTDDYFQVEVDEELYNSFINTPDKYIWNGENVVENPDYEDIVRQKEQERINNLTMTALDFINVLESAGLTSQQIEDYLNANLKIKHQLQYCQNVYCGVVRQLLPLEVEGITITDDMVVRAFKLKNGEAVDSDTVEVLPDIDKDFTVEPDTNTDIKFEEDNIEEAEEL